jgi:hypothetical protein
MGEELKICKIYFMMLLKIQKNILIKKKINDYFIVKIYFVNVFLNIY